MQEMAYPVLNNSACSLLRRKPEWLSREGPLKMSFIAVASHSELPQDMHKAGLLHRL